MIRSLWMGSIFPSIRLRATLITIIDTVLLWIERSAQRRALAQLDLYLLHDIGLSRTDAEQEAGKPFWRG